MSVKKIYVNPKGENQRWFINVGLWMEKAGLQIPGTAQDVNDLLEALYSQAWRRGQNARHDK